VKGRKNLTQRAKVRELIEHLSPTEIGTRLGISRQRVYQILSDEEMDYLPLRREQRQRRRVSRNLARHLGPAIAYVDRSTRGAISELLVAADLLALGWKPYVPLFRNHGHDLIATKSAMTITVEVRSAPRAKDASIAASIYTPGRRSDHFAFVMPDEPVIYKPELPAVSGEVQGIVPVAPISDLEREKIREGTKAGLARARTESRVGGRRPTYTDEQIREAKAAIDRGAPWAKAAASIGISVTRLRARIMDLCRMT
jgi:DNA invertase Pin-like site-specific DNA recombinase